MKINKISFILVLSIFFLNACSNDDDLNLPDVEVEEEEEPIAAFQTGILISNEGPFGSGSGSVSFINSNLTSVQNTIYEAVNGETLGNIVQSIGFDSGDQAYIISNNSNRVDVVNRFTFEQIQRIETGLQNPRFFIEANGFGYISNWGDPVDPNDDYIAVLDIRTFEMITTIPVSEGPEELLFNGTSIYVTQQGGFGVNDVVTVINPANNQVISEIQVAEVPNGLQLDSQGNLWVLCGGFATFDSSPFPESQGRLVRINTDSNTVDQSFDFPMELHPNFLNIDGDTIYYFLNGGVFTGSALDYTLPTDPSFNTSFLWNMEVEDGFLYGCNAGDFASNGIVEVYDVIEGILSTTLDVGIIPGGIYFNN